MFNNKKFLNVLAFFLEEAKKEREIERNDNITRRPSTEEPKERGMLLCSPIIWDKKRDMS